MLLLSLPLLGGCKILSLVDDRKRRQQHIGGFAAEAYVEGIWTARALPYLQQSAVPISALFASINADFASAGKSYGHQTGEGSPWTFVAKGEGEVKEVQRQSREGRAEFNVSDANGLAVSMGVQIGPVVSGDLIRDALPFVTFDDFPDQIAFADVGHSLTEHALRAAGRTITNLTPGQRIQFLGVFALAAPKDPIVLTPVRLEETKTSTAGNSK